MTLSWKHVLLELKYDKKIKVFFCVLHCTACLLSCHICVQSESALSNCLHVKEILA